ncbi:phage major capsid protein, P2 family [Hydrogenovibrio marinus]|uniref:Capsid protein n=1 Tax=Hydrogenovibrio marinus TaxID=28885 RepID=A0A066ZXM1_HYDMR|nr:phage major capsid protein, P2 family [Hydrogenovibrio marinus]KDN94855.1 capsid protein [Hydrogenovibrio marinus]BBN59315.1 phage capsid protein [Hydrogenovibrio marinus]
MNQNTRLQFNALSAAMAKQYGVEDVTQTFAVTPSKHQEIIAATKEKIDFLDKINTITVDQQSGTAIGLDASGMIMGRTDTSANPRVPRDPTSMSGTDYNCTQTNSDTFLSYAKMDAWAHKKNFKSIVAEQIRKLIALNKIQIGWYGESEAATTDPNTYTKGEDVKKGWLQKLREQYAENFLSEGTTPGEIRIGLGVDGGANATDFKNLDLLVNDVKQMIDTEFEDDEDLVVIIGSELLGYEKAKFYSDHGNTPSEKSKIEDMQVIGTYGGLPAYKTPKFPGRGIVVTSFSNLSIYEQNGTMRRRVKDNPDYDRVDTFQSQNMDYVIEKLGKMAAIEFKNVKLWNEATSAWY